MTATDMHEAKFSKITLALLEDSGWYKPNYTLADYFAYGKDRGCDFITNNCKSNTKYPEFCHKD